MKKIIINLLLFIGTYAFILFAFWAGGHDFERSPEMGAILMLGMLASLIAVLLVDLPSQF